LLRALADGEFHSGETLANRFGVTRTTVHNALQDVPRYGLVLHSVRGRGYQLASALQWLDRAQIAAQLDDARDSLHIEIVDHAPSTNAMLLQRAAQGAASGTVLAAEWQSAGRGRMGRAWYSGLGDALTFSLLWRFGRGLGALSGLSLAVGVSVMRALRELGVTDARLKWPNDVLLGEGKLAGILIEAQGDMLGPSAVVIGIGLNLKLSQQARAHIDQNVSDLGTAAPERNHALAVVLKHLVRALREFAAHGFEPFRAEWERDDAFAHKTVRLSLPDGGQITGISRGVTDGGALRLDTRQGEQSFNAGEVSLRGA
jgi:BirA family biotin operon repressor/biotin-[acetyl-CoA-carboxylase] ligase